MTYTELQKHQKQLAAEIKAAKATRKSVPHGYVAGLDYQRDTYRHHHIAYCLLRGRTIEQIERSSNDPHNEDWVKRIIELEIDL